MDYNLKKAIKSNIEKLPLGSTVLLPCLKFIYLFFIYKPLHIRSKYLKKRTEIKEAKEILKACQLSHVKEVIVIYDLLSSPPTYGDFLYVVMLARYFFLFKKKVNFWIINSEFRYDTREAYSVNEIQKFINNILEIPQVLLNFGNTIDIKTYTWPETLSLLDKYKNNASSYICFKQLVTERKAIYLHCFNVINYLFKLGPKIEHKKFLLFAEDLLSYLNIEIPRIPYITWHVRYSTKWGFNRNLTDDEFARIYASLSTLFPDHKIMIVSDEIGCGFFKKLSLKKNLGLIFSKDFSHTFMGDAALILKSDYFFALRGGGISAIPIFSQMRYGIIATPVHESTQSKNKIALWSTKEQVFKNAAKGMPDDIFLSKSMKIKCQNVEIQMNTDYKTLK